ncbi:MAG: hypothetical protein CR982_08870 [Candidatus Cloacimonadota bacterium]|nr:MAG: hypothetical protein CR982_08870 [Candidatus Cloacimonadota bacterium]PIE77746.1 MAG: hypothetical protein CSA15_11525 [Candidatus Delongbacteria bacterium]
MSAKLNDSKWKSIFSGNNNFKLENFSFSMMIGRLSRKFKKDPSLLKECIEEANSFCSKYESILGNDLAKLKNA